MIINFIDIIYIEIACKTIAENIEPLFYELMVFVNNWREYLNGIFVDELA